MHQRKENSIRGLVRRPEGKRPLGRHRHKGNYNIKMDLKKVRLGGMDWIDLARDGDRWYLWHLNCCYGMSHCYYSVHVELIVILQAQHKNNRNVEFLIKSMLIVDRRLFVKISGVPRRGYGVFKSPPNHPGITQCCSR
jgi:hypothetical protein